MSRNTPHAEMCIDEWMKRERNKRVMSKQDSSNLAITHILIPHLGKWVVQCVWSFAHSFAAGRLVT